MIDTNATVTRNLKHKQDFSLYFGLVSVVLFFAVNGFISGRNVHILSEDAAQVSRTHDAIQSLDNLISLLKDAETGQRGFVLTGNEKYLTPYYDAVTHMAQYIGDAEALTQDVADAQLKMSEIRLHINAKMSELAETIELRRTKGFQAALDVVISDRGKSEMDVVRTRMAEMQQEEREIRIRRTAEMEEAKRVAIVSGVIAALTGILLSIIVAYLLQRAASARRRQLWLQAGQVGLSKAMLGDLRMELLGEVTLKFLAEYVDAQVGALYVKDGDVFRRTATYGLPADAQTPESVKLGEGLLGQAGKDKKTFAVNDVPEGYLMVGSVLGHTNPRHLIISPTTVDDTVNAVLELGFIHPFDDLTLQLLAQLSESIGTSVRSANYRASLQHFLEETQRQSEELQTQSEELRVSNEELEEQSRALKESQFRLEQQQAELEQTNAQLEEQTQALEEQRDDLEKTKSEVSLKAKELEQASKYKSDFLANMSHELRTPLNSSLILAKLLADNPEGNLSQEQVKFAQTIQSSGNDLLTLINDILDLSKIEAGHMEMRPEPVLLERLIYDLKRNFEPVAGQKRLELEMTAAPQCPQSIQTDRLRLEQVLKNLLSNALKFTEKGKVQLRIHRAANGKVVFSVTDTGIGIAEEQQYAIFDAFRQADSTISRKFGGTGLGLSISRELTRLLGGTIELKSEVGHGSTFTIILPENYDSALVTARSARISPPPASKEPSTVFSPVTVPPMADRGNAGPKAGPARSRHLEDDRERLTSKKRVILVIEDDKSFAEILSGLIHELGFQCLLASTAEEGIAVAIEYVPSAVVLDVGLPDNSGLSVLDRLKHNPRTRHIPVHIVSADDHAQTAFSLGAMGHVLKPVAREELIEVLKKLETRFAQRMRRVLIVEDDAVQRESMRKLLGSHEVETVGVGSAAECLNQLKQFTFDCMVLDLSLPDATGYSLLETLSRHDAYSFPPVIVYTGRDLSADEEQRLRRYSKSIIIKGARSPERLLDEVTLFLHQVVADLPPEQQRMLEKARNRDAILENRHILIVEDDVRNVYALNSILEPRGAMVHIARNGLEALKTLEKMHAADNRVDLVLMDVMMPEMDGLTATREIRKRAEWKKLPVIMLTAKAMQDDQEKCLEAGANDYMAKPLDVEKLLSLVRVWMPR